jgi:hypothetical protein
MGSRALEFALRKLRGSGRLKNGLPSEDLSRIRRSIREGAIFSAKVDAGMTTTNGSPRRRAKYASEMAVEPLMLRPPYGLPTASRCTTQRGDKGCAKRGLRLPAG